MKFCEKHWSRLRKAIDDRGLGHLVAKSGEALFAKMSAELNGTGSEAQTFDPLMGAHNALLANIGPIAGPELMFGRNPEGGEWCPVCILLTCQCGDPACGPRFEGWIERAADDMVTVARELKLTLEPS